MLTVGTATAQSISNTGVPANVNASFQDAKWQVSTNNGATWIQALQVQSPPSPPWASATAAYSWISATTTGSNGGGNYLFRTFFDLTGYDPSTATLSFRCAIDNLPTNAGFFSLNGAAFGGLCGSQSNGYQLATMQTLVSGFTGGMNELRFAVSGDSRTDGLLVANASLSANVNVVPVLARGVLVGMGVISLAAVARRRKSTN